LKSFAGSLDEAGIITASRLDASALYLGTIDEADDKLAGITGRFMAAE